MKRVVSRREPPDSLQPEAVRIDSPCGFNYSNNMRYTLEIGRV